MNDIERSEYIWSLDAKRECLAHSYAPSYFHHVCLVPWGFSQARLKSGGSPFKESSAFPLALRSSYLCWFVSSGNTFRRDEIVDREWGASTTLVPETRWATVIGLDSRHFNWFASLYNYILKRWLAYFTISSWSKSAHCVPFPPTRFFRRFPCWSHGQLLRLVGFPFVRRGEPFFRAERGCQRGRMLFACPILAADSVWWIMFVCDRLQVISERAFFRVGKEDLEFLNKWMGIFGFVTLLSGHFRRGRI